MIRSMGRAFSKQMNIFMMVALLLVCGRETAPCITLLEIGNTWEGSGRGTTKARVSLSLGSADTRVCSVRV